MFLFRIAVLLPLFFGIYSASWAQTTISEWTYEPLQGTNNNPTPNLGSGSSSLVGVMTSSGGATGMNTASGCGAQSSGTNAWALTAAPGTSNESSGVQYNVSTVGFEGIQVRWEQRWSGTATNTVRLQYTTDGTTWINFTMTGGVGGNTTFCNGAIDNGRFETNTTGDQYRRIVVNLSSITAANNNPNFGFRVLAAHYRNTGQFRQVATPANEATGGTWRFDNVRVSGTALPPSLDPTVTVNANLSPFNYILGFGPSANQSFTVGGINLTNNIVVSVPAGFEQALSASGPYQTSAINLTPVAGTVSTTSIFVRLQANLATGAYSGDISIASDAITSPNVISISGAVVSETLPYVENFGTTAGQFPIGWTRSGAAGNNWIIDLASTSAPLGSGGANLADNGSMILNQEAVITCNRAISTVGNSLVRVKFNARKTTAYTGIVLFDYSIDGTNWTNVPFTDVPNDGNWNTVFFFLPLDAANVDNLRVRFRATRTNSSGNYRIDDFTLLPEGIEVNLSASAAVGNEIDETEITITATTASPVDNDETIVLAVTGTNISNQDYEFSAPSIFIPAGQSTGSVIFKVLNDNLNEQTETATITFQTLSFDLQPGSETEVTIIDAGHDALYLTTMNAPYPTITFDNLQNSGNPLFDIPAGFYLLETGDNANSFYRAANGSESTGDTYSFGANLSSDRALGSINTTPGLVASTYGARIVNTTGQTMHGLNVAYTGEQWRRGSAAADQLTFAYSTNATALDNGTWTQVLALNFQAIHTNGTGTSLDGNAAVNQTQLNVPIFGVNLPAGQEMWIRWVDADVSGTDHGLAIDNLTITPFQVTQLSANACNATNVSVDQAVFAALVGAPAYRFRISGANNANWVNNTVVIDRDARWFKFNPHVIGEIAGETYTVEVALGDGNGNFGPYGNSCTVTLAGLAAQPTTQLGASNCNATNVLPSTAIFANQVQEAQGYRFRIVGSNNGNPLWSGNTFILTRTERWFRFDQHVPGFIQGATYNVEVAYLTNDGFTYSPYGNVCSVALAFPATQLVATVCNAVDVPSNTALFAIQIPQAQGYRFRIVGPNNGNLAWDADTIIVTRTERWFRFDQHVPGSIQGATYQIRVAFLTNDGVTYSPFGPVCSVSLFAPLEKPTNDNNDIFVDNKTMTIVEFGANASHNPFTTDFGIQVLNTNDVETINVVIYDMSGKLIERSAVNPMDIESARFGANLASGMYMIEVRQGSNQAVIRQVKN